MPKRAPEDADTPPPSKAPRLPGGYKQQLRWSAPPAPSTRSTLASVLMEKWCWGDASAPFLQEVAAAAQKDGAVGEDLEVLANLGMRGQYPGNCHAELAQKLKAGHVSEALAYIYTYMFRPPRSLARVAIPFLLPHVMFAVLYKYHPAAFLERMCGGAFANIGAFWRAMDRHPMYQNHPIKKRADHQARCIPLSVHADAVPVSGVGRSWGKSLEIYSWNSMLSTGATVLTLFLICMYFPKLQVKEPEKDVAKAMSRKLRWSLHWLFVGKWPERDEFDKPWGQGSPEALNAGKLLADGYYATLWVIRGDLDEMAKGFGLRHPSSRQPCNCCKADSSGVPWTEAHPSSSKWLSTIWKDSEWLGQHPDRHPLFRLPGVSISAYVPDVMHCMHLGTYQYLFGSVLKLLTHHILKGRPEDNLATVWAAIAKHYTDCRAMCILSGPLVATRGSLLRPIGDKKTPHRRNYAPDRPCSGKSPKNPD